MMTDEQEVLWRYSESADMHERILVVDDERMFLDGLRYALTSYGYDVTLCENATEALLKCMADEYNYIITDYEMPGMNGIELVSRLRKRFPMTVIIGMSALDRGEKFLRAGANDFLEKPFAPYRLAMMIDGGDLDI